jgi:hypothetical protein
MSGWPFRALLLPDELPDAHDAVTRLRHCCPGQLVFQGAQAYTVEVCNPAGLTNDCTRCIPVSD